MNTNEYQQALETTKLFLDEPIGYSTHPATSSSDRQLVRQNNIIICLLEMVIIKENKILETLKEFGLLIGNLNNPLDKQKLTENLTSIDKKLENLETSKVNKKPENQDISSDIQKLIDQISGLNIGRPVKPREQKTYTFGYR